jgi:hypothetical protein
MQIFFMAYKFNLQSKNKFRARSVNGFPSKLESAVHDELLRRQILGEIKNIKRQQVVDLGFTIKWKIDFSFELVETGELIYAEAKGIETEDFKLKLKLYRYGQGKHPLEIYRGSYKSPKLTETVYPKALGD